METNKTIIMQKTRVRDFRRLSEIFLQIIPFLTLFVFAWIRMLRTPGVWQMLAGLQIAAIAVAAWKLGASAIRSQAEHRRGLALTGALLVAPWAVVAFLIGMGPPWWANEAENRMRFEALFIARILIPGGFVVLWATLREAGERFYSLLGFAATMLAGPLMLIFGTFQLAFDALLAQASSGQPPEWLLPLNRQAGIVDDLEVILTYLATAAFAVALLRIGWLGRGTSRVFVGISLFAVLCLTVAAAVVLQFPPGRLRFETASLGVKIAFIPGFVFGIPAIPFIIPSLMGVTLLRRAGEEHP